MLKISGIPKADHPFFVKEVCIGKGSEASFIRGEARSDSGRLVVGLSHLASVNFAEQYSSLKFFLIDRFLFAETLYVNHPMEFFECSIGFFQAEDGIRDLIVTGVQTCALPIFPRKRTKTRQWNSLVRYTNLRTL